MENSIEIPQKIKNRTTISSKNLTPEYIAKGGQETNLKIYMHLNVHSGIIYNSQDRGAI